MKAIGWGCVLVVTSGAAVACGSSAQPSSSADAGGGDDAALPDAAVDGGDSGPGADGGRYAGQVLVESLGVESPTMVVSQYSLGARFGDASGFATFGAPCSGVSMGACCFSAAGGPGEPPASAGAVTFSKGGQTLATLMPDSAGAYATAQTNASEWLPGDTIGVSASGGAVGAFSASIVAVSDPKGVSWSAPGMSSVPLGQDLLVNWTASGQPGLKFGLSLTAPEGRIDCLVDDAAAKLTLPKALLGRFKTGDQGTVQYAGYGVADASAGNATIQIVSASGGFWQTTYQ